MAIDPREIDAVPDGAVIGVIGENESGQAELLHTGGLRGGIAKDASGFDDIQRQALARDLAEMRKQSKPSFIACHDADFLRRIADEVWWVHEGKLMARGDPGEVVAKYQHHVALRLRQMGDGAANRLAPSLRRGDGRAEITSLETLNAAGAATMVWTSGEEASIRVSVRFAAAVDDPVVGIMIRTRIGFEVYGTNTELEKVKLGPCQAGDVRRVTFTFKCDLCPQEYTLTAASHDPDGVWHDWLEDAVAFSVVDSRYTAGVANLRARVTQDKQQDRQ